jgi:hypothetical protein
MLGWVIIDSVGGGGNEGEGRRGLKDKLKARMTLYNKPYV